MSTNPDEMTMASLLARMSKMEQEMAALRTARETRSAQEVSQPRLDAVGNAGDAPAAGRASRKRSSRRALLRTAVVAATTVVGAGALLGKSAGVAHANGSEGPTTFTSTNGSVPAVTAIGSGSGYAVSVQSGGGSGAAGVYVLGGSSYGVYASATGSLPAVEATNGSGPALVANGHMQVQGDAVGTATLLAGQTKVTVTTSAATASSNVMLTPLANPKANLWVTRSAGSFTIHASTAPTSNLAIAYLIIN